MNRSMQGANTPYARNLTLVKNYFKKPLTLVIGLLSLLLLVMQHFVLNSKVTSILESLQALAASKGATMENIPSAGSPVEMILSAIVSLCIILIFVFSINSSMSSSPAPFFTTLHALSLLQLIVNAIVAVLVLISGVLFTFMGSAILTSLSDSLPEGADMDLSSLTPTIDAFKISIIIFFALLIVYYAIYLTYLNSQTAFMKSCARSCREPLIMRKGAKTYGNLSIFLAVLSLVALVIVYLLFFSSGAVEDMTDTLGSDIASLFSSIKSMMYLAFAVSGISVVRMICIGVVAKGYDKYAMENESVDTSSVSIRSPEANPIPTYKSDLRQANNATHQSQPYLYGEEDNTDPNKKSQYIPEELQQNNFQAPAQQNPYNAPMQYDPQFGQSDPFAPQGDPFAQPPMGGNPYGQPDPFAPMGTGTNPYGGQPMNPNDPFSGGMM